MCKDASDSGRATIQELRHAAGLTRQCSSCGCIAVQFGTSYLVFDEIEFFRFVAWFRQADWEGLAVGKDHVHVQLGGDSPMMLVLTEAERHAFADLLTNSFRWVLERRPRSAPLLHLASQESAAAVVH